MSKGSFTNCTDRTNHTNRTKRGTSRDRCMGECHDPDSKEEKDFFKKVLFKTRMCNDPENCEYGDNCRFAHDPSEIRSLRYNANKMKWGHYRTRLCKHYQTGTCKFGENCSFLHYYEHEVRKRMPIFQEITRDTIVIPEQAARMTEHLPRTSSQRTLVA